MYENAKPINHFPLNDQDYRVILLLAENNMKATETAYALKVHRNTVCWRIKKIKDITGLDPMNFYDLYALVLMAKAREDVA